MQGYYGWLNTTLILQVVLQPQAAQSAFVGEYNGRLKIRITAPPVDGKANALLIAFLAKAFKVPKSQVQLQQGALSRQKTVAIEAPKHLPEGLNIAPPAQ